MITAERSAPMALDQRVERLERALVDLAEAQARTERVLTALVEAQARTEARVGRLEEQMERVEAALARLAEAQARTEERLDRLAEAQARTEARLAETQTALQLLVQQVGRLSDTIGFTLEDLAREVSPAYLARHYGIEVEVLERRVFVIDGEEVEIDFFGVGTQRGEPVAVVGEARSRIYGRDVREAVDRIARLQDQLPARGVPVLFGFVVHPSAREVAGRLDAILITSSGR
ncbi:MAG: hypothetical protein QN203_11200 [Armatimonadota bacterium]|nr:hypothetical protein [Armatimonadota bacterium]MDR7533562.1 hypothetical protein [Armatimonadota bacterium]